jgi:hydrogenase expression/formation protein HypE
VDIIDLSYGSGGKNTHKLINDVICKHLPFPELLNMGDAAYLENIAFTTDSFVVTPEFFFNGDIGKLAVCGTANDLTVSGAKPQFLSLALVIPEGYKISDLEKIIESIKITADEINLRVVCGDTKVVDHASLKSIIVNTAGIGPIIKKLNDYEAIKVGDNIIITSDIARHGISILLSRGELKFTGIIESDCCHLYKIFKNLNYDFLHFARDATRGGVAAVLKEISFMSKKGFLLYEKDIVIKNDVKYLCEMLGFEPLSVANEGVAVIIVERDKTLEVLDAIKKSEYGSNAFIAGEVIEKPVVLLKNIYGGLQNVEMPSGLLLPRIC